jgi:hypothetical protein
LYPLRFATALKSLDFGSYSFTPDLAKSPTEAELESLELCTSLKELTINACKVCDESERLKICALMSSLQIPLERLASLTQLRSLTISHGKLTSAAQVPLDYLRDIQGS